LEARWPDKNGICSLALSLLRIVALAFGGRFAGMFLNAKTPPGFGYLVPGANRVKPCKTRIQIRRFMHYLSDIIPLVDERDGQGGKSIPHGATFLVEMLS
jgi:hypothetical protein